MNPAYTDMYDALREAGATEQKALAAVADLPIPQHLATKEDLVQALGEIKVEIADLRGEIKTESANLRGDIKAEIASLRAEIANEFKGLYRWLLVSAVSITAVIVGILKLFP